MNFDWPLDSRSRVKLIVLGAALVLLAFSLVCNLLSSGRGYRERARTQKSTDFVVTWACLACDHKEDRLAGAGPQPCPKCGRRELYASVLFTCKKHGEFRVAFNYDERGKPRQVKIAADRPWVPYLDLEKKRSGVECPVCGGDVIPAETARIPTDSGQTATPDSPSESPAAQPASPGDTRGPAS